MNKFKIAICQMMVEEEKKKNLKKAEEMIRGAVASKGAQMVVLPEIFNCPYNNEDMFDLAEDYPGESTNMLSKIAKELQIYLIGGSIPEKAGEKIYNTSFVFGPDGGCLGFHRKMHLFDIDIKGKISFKESNVLDYGNKVTVIDTKFCKIGIAICYDMRFPELMRLMALEGSEVVIVPAAFNTTTGPAHWHETIKTRAVDNQVYFVAAAPARNPNAQYQAYGHSKIVNPWGDVVAETHEGEGIVCGEIDLDYLKKVREELPLLKHRRRDLYELKSK